MQQPLKSPQQEEFARQLAQGKSQADAYRIAYPASVNWKDASIWQKASALAANVKVQSRVATLQAPAMRVMEVTLSPSSLTEKMSEGTLRIAPALAAP
jgi:hypothetical protein